MGREGGLLPATSSVPGASRVRNGNSFGGVNTGERQKANQDLEQLALPERCAQHPILSSHNSLPKWQRELLKGPEVWCS